MYRESITNQVNIQNNLPETFCSMTPRIIYCTNCTNNIDVHYTVKCILSRSNYNAEKLLQVYVVLLRNT